MAQGILWPRPAVPPSKARILINGAQQPRDVRRNGQIIAASAPRAEYFFDKVDEIGRLQQGIVGVRDQPCDPAGVAGLLANAGILTISMCKLARLVTERTIHGMMQLRERRPVVFAD